MALCTRAGIPFDLGQALFMKASHGGEASHDKIDAHKLAVLLCSGMLPQAYVYPADMRATRNLLRRRMHLMRQRATWLGHIHHTTSQDHLRELGQQLAYQANRDGGAARFPDPAVQQRIEVDRARIDHDNQLLRDMELAILPTATPHNANTRSLRRTVPGSREILRLVLLDEIHAIPRVPRGQDVVSSGRLVKGCQGIGGQALWPVLHEDRPCLAHVGLFGSGRVVPAHPSRQNYLARLEKQHGQGKALTVLAHQLARAVYHLFTRQMACDMSLLLQREQGAARVRRTSHGTSMGCA